MRKTRFKGPLLEGHKEDAIEVPFDPEERWSVPPRALWPGRRGHPVQGTLNRITFDSFVVGRSRRFYVLVTEHVRLAAKLSPGDIVDVTLEPREESARPDRQGKTTVKQAARKKKITRSAPPAR